MTENLTILHLSDTHFGVVDSRQELPRITDSLLDAARAQRLIPDLCVFTGDLTHSAKKQDFEQGAVWLSKIVDLWPNTKIFVVPGNHDVERDAASLVLRQVSSTEISYNSLRPKLKVSMAHLRAFNDGVKILKRTLGNSLISSWDDIFGCSASLHKNGRKTRIIGLNTCILSCDDYDQGILVADIATLNKHLSSRNDPNECVIVAAHHPLSWLAPWNSAEITRLLKQETGAHLFLHGHQHEQSGASSTTTKGESLAILESGASYQGSQWPQYFSSYQLIFDHGQIDCSIYALSPSSGLWPKNNERSGILSARLPRSTGHILHGATDTTYHENLYSTFSEPQNNAESTAIRIGFDDLELKARRRREYAENVFEAVVSILDKDFLATLPLYRFQKRLKSLDRICQKVADRNNAGAHEYSVDHVEDICGFRVVAIFQSDIPKIISTVIKRLVDHNGLVRIDRNIRITVHTSRPENDPLAIKPLIEGLKADWSGECSINYVNRPSGYSSVHVVVDSVVNRANGVSVEMPIEFQFRSGLEEFWGQLDHRLRYFTNRGAIADAAWQRHLNVLKTLFDAAIQYVDVIRDAADQARSQPRKHGREGGESSLSISLPRNQLDSLKGLPISVFKQLSSAYDLWIEADASSQFGAIPGKYRKAADEFRPLEDGCPAIVIDLILREKLAYTARMERAYMLSGTGDRDALAEAEQIYTKVLEESPEDATALLRMAQVYILTSRFVDSTDFLDRAIKATEASAASDKSSDEARIYDYCLMNKALVYFRQFEQDDINKTARLAAIKNAVRTAKIVYEGGRNEKAKIEALNDMVYYLWEEGSLSCEGNDGEEWNASYFESSAKILMARLEKDDDLSYREYDTLARVAHKLGLTKKASEYSRQVLLRLEGVARSRDGNGIDESERFNALWAASVVPKLSGNDEIDSLKYSLRIEQTSMGRDAD